MTAVYLFGGVLVVLLLVVLFAALRPGEDGADGEGPEARLREAVEELRELEFDYRTGKVAEEDYRAQRTEIGARAVRARDEMRAAGSRPPEPEPPRPPEPEAPRPPGPQNP